MIVLAAALFGVVLGGLTAKRRKGSLADMAQYAVAFGIGFSVIGVMVTIVIHRMAI